MSNHHPVAAAKRLSSPHVVWPRPWFRHIMFLPPQLCILPPSQGFFLLWSPTLSSEWQKQGKNPVRHPQQWNQEHLVKCCALVRLVNLLLHFKEWPTGQAHYKQQQWQGKSIISICSIATKWWQPKEGSVIFSCHVWYTAPYGIGVITFNCIA